MKSHSMAATLKFNNSFLTKFLTQKDDEEVYIEKEIGSGKENNCSKVIKDIKGEQIFTKEKMDVKMSSLESIPKLKANGFLKNNNLNQHKKSVGGSLHLNHNNNSVTSSNFYTPLYKSNEREQRTKQQLDLKSFSNNIVINKKTNFSLNKLDNSLNSGQYMLQQAKGNSISEVSGIKGLISPMHKLNLRTPKSAVINANIFTHRVNKTSITKSPLSNTAEKNSNNSIKIIKEKKVPIKRNNMISGGSLGSYNGHINKTAHVIRKEYSQYDMNLNKDSKHVQPKIINIKATNGIIKKVKKNSGQEKKESDLFKLINNEKKRNCKFKNEKENYKKNEQDNIEASPVQSSKKNSIIDLSNAPKIFTHFLNNNKNSGSVNINLVNRTSEIPKNFDTQETKHEIMQIISNMNGKVKHPKSINSGSASIPKDQIYNFSKRKNTEDKRESNMSNDLSLLNYMNYKREEEKKDVFIRNKYKTLLEDYLIRSEY